MDDNTLVGAIDLGTSSSRFLVFSAKDYQLITYHQTEVKTISTHAGWVEMDPYVIINSVKECIDRVAEYLEQMGLSHTNIKAIGVTNHRETTILWDKFTHKPLYNAIVWLDTRTASTVDELLLKCNNNPNCLKKECGLPISTYFSALKIKWLMDNVLQVKSAIKEDRCAFGTVDSWLLWNLIGDSVHLTDVTNASRTMLMNLKTLAWDEQLCKFFGVPMNILPEIRSSAENFGKIKEGPLKGVPITAVLGDQQAALVGQCCFEKGSAKNTYGTGCFMLYNTGNDIVYSTHGLITTVGYQFGKEKPVYALEGSVAIAGACFNWLKDNLEILPDVAKTEELANDVQNTGGVYFVPAFSGLFAPHWKADARGLIIGLTQYTKKAHIIRAALESVAFQNLEIVESINKDTRFELKELQVSGGMTKNKLLLQLQADFLGIPIVRQSMHETTAFGAALAAGIVIGVWDPSKPIPINNSETYNPAISNEDRIKRYKKWKQAVQRSIGWDDERTVVRKSFMQGIKEDPVKFLLKLAIPITTSYIFYKYFEKKAYECYKISPLFSKMLKS